MQGQSIALTWIFPLSDFRVIIKFVVGSWKHIAKACSVG